MQVCVIGAAGYIGVPLCKHLVGKGHTVIAIDNGFFGFVALEDLANGLSNKIEIVKKDAFNLTIEDLKNCETVISIAGLSNDPMADFNPELNFKLNTDLTEFTANVCKKAGVKRYIFASTCSMYDFGFLDEKNDVLVDEDTVVSPVKHYSLSKFNAEQRLKSLIDRDFNVIILRKATICGFSTKMRYDLVVNTFVKDALKNKKIKLNGGGENWRPLIDIDDVCEVYARCVNLNKSCLYNVVGYNTRISELALRAVSLLKKSGHDVDIECNYEFPKSEIRNYRVDGSKLWKELDFRPYRTAEDSIKGILQNIDKINDFNNHIYYNIEWFRRHNWA